MGEPRSSTTPSYTDYFERFWSAEAIAAASFDTLSTGERQRVDAIIEAVPTDATSVLDAGCGSGVVVNELLARRQIRVAGLEIAAAPLEHVRAQRILGSTDAMPVPDGSFDVVVLADVLEHLPHGVFERTLAEVSRVAARYVVVNSPHREPLDLARTKCQRCTTAFHASRHARSIAREDVENWFPAFELLSWRLCGVERRRRLRGLQLVAQALGDAWYRPDRAVCPNCGYPVTPPTPNQAVRVVNGAIQRAVGQLLPSEPSEFVALLSRR